MTSKSFKRVGILRELLLACLLACLSPAALGAEAAPAAAEVSGGDAADPLGRSTPRGTVLGFLQAIDAGQDERAAQYLDLRNLPGWYDQYEPRQLARGLAIVLQRAAWIDIESVSDDPDGTPADGLPSYRDELVRLETSEKPVRVYLQRVPGPEGTRIWKFSNATIAELQLLYDEYRYSPYVEWLYDNLPAMKLLHVELFKWVATLSGVLVALPFVLLLAWLLSRVIIKPDQPMHAALRRFLLGPVSTLVLVLIANAVLRTLGTGLAAQELARGYTVITVVVIWVLLQGINLTRDIYVDYLLERGRPGSVALLRPLTSATKMIVALLGGLVWLDNLGYEITALLAGLGVGGIAVALVLQKPLEDVFGAITLYTQQPIRIGDFGRFGAVTGTVEEISLRTTRIRTLQNSVVAVPNMRLASEPIENLSAREKYLFQPMLRLSNDSTRQQLEAVLSGVRELLKNDPRVIDDAARVRFTDISTVSFDLAVFAYINAADWAGYLEAAEALNFQILGAIEDAGARLATPIADLLDGRAG